MASTTFHRVNSQNSGYSLNIGNGPQSGPPLYCKAKGREAAHQFTIEPKAAKRPTSFQCGQRPHSGSSLSISGIYYTSEI